MNDYSFGNYISTLRMRKGLSQYQLGVLAGVTDKAVSKWENGAAKPGIKRCMVLANILGVTLDELLSCEYNSIQNNRKDLFAMKTRIWKSVEEQLHFLYGEKLPLRVINRFEHEKTYMENHNMLIWYEFLGLLRKHLHEKREVLEVRGNPDASFTAWLLGATNVNPLPAHYYCPVCKNVAFISGFEDGYDMPEQYCDCGAKLIRDGHNITVGNVFPVKQLHFEIELSERGILTASELLKNYFSEYASVIEVVYEDAENEEDMPPEICAGKRYIIVDKNEAKKYPSNIWRTNIQEYYGKSTTYQSIDFLLRAKTVENVIGIKKRKADDNIDIIRHVVNDEKRLYHVQSDSLKRYISNRETVSFSEITKLLGFFMGSGTWDHNAEILLESGMPMKELISCREDVFDYVNERIHASYGADCASGLALKVRESVQKGRYYANGVPDEIRHALKSIDIPDWYIESMEKIKYLPSKAHLIALLQEYKVDKISMKEQNMH